MPEPGPGQGPARSASRHSLVVKLSLAFLLAGIVSIGLVALVTRVVTVREFESFFVDRSRADFVDRAAEHYAAQGSWSGIRRKLAPPPGPDGRPRPPDFAIVDSAGRVVLPARPYREGRPVSETDLSTGYPIVVDGIRVGTVLDTERGPRLSTREQQFIAATDRSLLRAALGAVLIALLLGIVLARGLTRPLRDLTEAIESMGRGSLEQSVPVRSEDELGALARAFNQMSAALARSNASRRQMTADIAHDLRTPLTVITGYIEGMQDGMLEPTPERLGAIHTEAQHLKHLVEDLRTLSLADAGDLRITTCAVDASALLERLALTFAHQAEQAEVALRIEIAPDVPPLLADPERLIQALGNLVANALEHTPAGGRVALSAALDADGRSACLAVTDTGAGIPAAALPRVFERFYRADPSRQRGGESTGLGLAIARSIVEAQGGRIEAHSDGPGQGSRFAIHLPLG